MDKPTLDRREVLAKLFPDPDTYLFVSGLAGSSKDAAGLADDGANLFTMAGTMGAAVSTGLGMALAAPDRQVAVICGDGELMMNLGSLATVASQAPANLTIVCIDNGCHGETGGQSGHTSVRTHLVQVAQGFGIASALLVETQAQLETSAAFVREAPGPRFVHVRVTAGPPTDYRRNLDLAECRIRFRSAYLASAQAQGIPVPAR